MEDNSTSCTSSDGYPSCQETITFLVIKYLIGSFLVFVILLAILGNVLVCIAIYTDRRLRKLGNLFLASLALADLFLASLVMTFAVANDMMGYWMFGNSFCEIWISFDVMCCTASILNLCAISLDRFFHIKDPLLYERWMTKKVIMSCVASIWIVSALISFVPISLGWHRPSSSSSAGDNSVRSDRLTSSPVEVQVFAGDRPTILQSSSQTSTLMRYDDISSTVLTLTFATGDDSMSLPQCALDLTPVYAVVSSLVSFYAPCLVMIALYTRLYLYAKKHVQNIKSMTKGLQSLEEGRRLTTGSDRPHSPKVVGPSHASEHKAAITLGVIMGTFLFCWVPFFVVNIIEPFCANCIPPLLFKVLTWLGYFNSAMNPIIYSIFNTEFREAFGRILISYVHNECCDQGSTRRTSRSPGVTTAKNHVDITKSHFSGASDGSLGGSILTVGHHPPSPTPIVITPTIEVELTFFNHPTHIKTKDISDI